MNSKPVLYAVLAAAVSVAAFDYGFDRSIQGMRIREHREIIHDNGLAPNRYRVLVPFAVEPFIRIAAARLGYDEAFRLVYAVVYAVGLWVLVSALFAYLTTWFSEERSLIGVLVTACTLPMGLRYHGYAPWSILEPTLLVAAFVAILSQRDGWILPLTVIASLNRETGILLPFALGLEAVSVRPWSMRRLRTAVLCTVVSVAIFVGLRVWRGNVPSVVSIGDVWRMNVSNQGLKTFIPAIVLFLGGTGWVLLARGLTNAPAFVKRMSWLIVFYVPLYLTFGYWYEVRLLMTLYPVLIPTVLSGIYRPGHVNQ